MLCSIVSIVSRLFLHSASDVRDVYCRVKASLGRRRLLSGRVVGREDGLLGLLADVHLELARDSLLLGHCGLCAGLYVCEGVKVVLVSVKRRADVCQRKRRQWLGGGGGRRVRAAQVAAAGELARKDYARRCKNAVAGSGKRSLGERARSSKDYWTGLDGLGCRTRDGGVCRDNTKI
jgi:hypothetical protein